MSKLIMWNLMSLDGYFEGNDKWDLSFHTHVWGDELHQLSLEQLQSAECLIFGRVTYEGMAGYWTSPDAQKSEAEIARLMNSIPKIVFSKTLKSATWNNTRVVSENASEEIRKLKAQGTKDLYLFGSANLSETFMTDDLFDEYKICVSPVILGSGRPLFRQGISAQNLSLIAAHPLKTGGVILRYTTS